MQGSAPSRTACLPCSGSTAGHRACSRKSAVNSFGWMFSSSTSITMFRQLIYTYLTPHGAHVQMGGRNRIDPHRGGIERLATRTRGLRTRRSTRASRVFFFTRWSVCGGAKQRAWPTTDTRSVLHQLRFCSARATCANASSGGHAKRPTIPAQQSGSRACRAVMARCRHCTPDRDGRRAGLRTVVDAGRAEVVLQGVEARAHQRVRHHPVKSPGFFQTVCMCAHNHEWQLWRREFELTLTFNWRCALHAHVLRM